MGSTNTVDKCVVKITTGYWSDKNGINVKKELRFLKRKCSGDNFLLADETFEDPSKLIEKIDNFYACKDGVYQVLRNDIGYSLSVFDE